MLRGFLLKVQLATLLWRQGVWEALQLQRCIVTFVLDGTGRVLAQTVKCCVVNGLIYLGSIALHHQLTSPATSWLLNTYAEPVYGTAAVSAWQQILGLVFQLLWLMPLYGISILVSCIWYQQIAAAAFAVQQQQVQQQQQQQQQQSAAARLHDNPVQPQQQQHRQQQHQQQQQQGHIPLNPLLAVHQQHPPAAAAAAAAAGGSSSSMMMSVLEGTAQEVFRVLLFLVFTLEVFVISMLPVVGPALNVLFLSWLYAYYCFDYKWSLQGERLPQRLAFFEAHWAFFAGFGFPCVAATVFFPFHIGAALANLLFPVFILVACASDPVAAERSIVVPGGPSLGSVPIFKLALWPTYWLVRRIFTGRSRARTA